MKTYNLFLNAAKKFESAYYVNVGSVKANNKNEAEKMANEYRLGNKLHDVDFTYNMDNDSRKLIASTKDYI